MQLIQERVAGCVQRTDTSKRDEKRVCWKELSLAVVVEKGLIEGMAGSSGLRDGAGACSSGGGGGDAGSGGSSSGRGIGGGGGGG
ncbi:hypothetical protein IAQ61_000387 [Plenodomus lingam]|uniref:uncharacterized protein n=1 Tax=Leptosphaeria maculans TaxID=5022 RepID=UPI0033244AE6|nr:hypothetical protein IAQ61_000387 [Plenodomus lingam]